MPLPSASSEPIPERRIGTQDFVPFVPPSSAAMVVPHELQRQLLERLGADADLMLPQGSPLMVRVERWAEAGSRLAGPALFAAALIAGLLLLL